MAEKKPKVAPKPKAKRAPAKPKVTLQSYSVRMVIPTGSYANIQPEIVVKTTDMDIAHDFIAPHMNKLWKEYFLINERKKESVLREQLYSLVPPDSNTVEKLPLVLEVKPDVSYYCLKNISVKRLDRQQYEVIKSIQAYKINTLQSQSLAVVHFNPDNILKRMKFRWAIEDEEAADANDQDNSTGAL